MARSAASRKLAAGDYTLPTAEGPDIHKDVRLAQFDVGPIAKFVIAPENPRRIRNKADVEALAANLKAHGVLSPLICYEEAGALRVTCGGTRLLAAKQAGIAALPYDLLAKPDAIRAGMAEQEGHTPLHPADQAQAYAAELARLNGEGPLTRDAAIKTIANRVGKSVRFVEQRLALANLHAPILQALREDKITVNQAAAWANASEEQQIALAHPARVQHLEPYSIRQLIEKAEVAADDRLAKFVGEAAYKAAGGAVRSDLFAFDHDDQVATDAKAKPKAFFSDRAALERAAKAKLDKEREKLLAEGWGFVSTNYRSMMGVPADCTEGKACKTKAEKAKAGAALSIDHDGKLKIYRNLRKRPRKPEPKPAGGGATAGAAERDAEAAKRDEIDLTCEYAEQIVGRSLRNRPGVALAALLAELARSLILSVPSNGGLLNLYPEEVSRDAKGLLSDEKSVAEFDRLEALLHPHNDDLETFIAEKMSDVDRGSLLVACVLAVMEVKWSPQASHSNHRRDQLATLGRLAGVDLNSHLTDSVADTIDLPMLRQLVGVDPIGKPAPKKPAAKAKKKPAVAK